MTPPDSIHHELWCHMFLRAFRTLLHPRHVHGLAQCRNNFYIDGKWVPPVSGTADKIDIVNPADEVCAVRCKPLDCLADFVGRGGGTATTNP